MKHKITQDRVLVKALPKQQKSSIFIPEDKLPQTYEVVAVGPGRLSDAGTLIKPVVKVGDEVMIGNHAVLFLDEVEYRLLESINVVVILNKESK